MTFVKLKKVKINKKTKETNGRVKVWEREKQGKGRKVIEKERKLVKREEKGVRITERLKKK